jgi:hypothetical protein
MIKIVKKSCFLLPGPAKNMGLCLPKDLYVRLPQEHTPMELERLDNSDSRCGGWLWKGHIIWSIMCCSKRIGIWE